MARRTVHVLALFRCALSLLSVLSLLGLLLAPAAWAQSAVRVVEPGDTLWQIAVDAGVDVATLRQVNGLEEGDALQIGQSLKLPGAPAAPAPSGKKYSVAEGDTLSSIAQQFGTTTAVLVDLNKVEDADRLALGTELSVPSGAASPPASAPAPAQASAAAARASAATHKSIVVSYTVQSGETLLQIARQFDVRSDAIAQASGLDDPNKLRVGAVLKVPLPGYEHVVKPGETLRDIALQGKVDLGSLIDFNNLEDPELIRVDQVILVPAPSPSLQVAAAPAPAASGAPAAAAPASAPSPAPVAQRVAQPQSRPAPAPAPAVQPPAGAAREGLAGAAMKLLGAPYVWGGSAPSGFDCSGFVWYVARQAGKSIGRGLLGQYSSGSHPSRDELKTGDLVFFQNTYTPGVSHNGVYVGNGQFVHAADEQSGVTVSSLNSAYWSSHWYGATRMP
jgi:peptidoglycan DL-endopeptidase LytF